MLSATRASCHLTPDCRHCRSAGCRQHRLLRHWKHSESGRADNARNRRNDEWKLRSHNLGLSCGRNKPDWLRRRCRCSASSCHSAPAAPRGRSRDPLHPARTGALCCYLGRCSSRSSASLKCRCRRLLVRSRCRTAAQSLGYCRYASRAGSPACAGGRSRPRRPGCLRSAGWGLPHWKRSSAEPARRRAGAGTAAAAATPIILAVTAW